MKSGCFRIPKRVREGAQLLAEDALIVIGVSLAAVGIVELSGWSSKELLQGYTPLLLAMFSIIVTVSALRLNIKEGRDRATRERNEAIRPVLALRTKLNDKEPSVTPLVEMYYPVYSEEPSSPIGENYVLDNIGLGAALKVRFICEISGELFLSAGEIDNIKSDCSVIFDLQGSSPHGYINRIITVYDDIFGNSHVSFHNMDFNNKFDGLIVFSNDCIELEFCPQKDEINDTLLSTYCSAENIIGN